VYQVAASAPRARRAELVEGLGRGSGAAQRWGRPHNQAMPARDIADTKRLPVAGVVERTPTAMSSTVLDTALWTGPT
jgi:hypothetical protein